MKRLWRAVEVLAWAAFFAFAALVLALRFWLLPNIERYRDDIVAAVSSTVGAPVKIGAIEAGWLGLRPRVSLFDLRVYDAQGREALVLPSLENVVAWRSLLAGGLRLHSLTIDGPRLALRRDAAGALYVAGIKLADSRQDGRAGDWLLDQYEIVVRNAEIEWRDDKRGAPPLALSALELRLRNFGHQHSLGLSAKPPPGLGSAFELRAELSGRSIGELASWNGRLYAEVGYTDLAAWRPWVDYPVDLRKGQGALRLWATLKDGAPAEGTADLELAGVTIALAGDLPPLELVSLSGRLHAVDRDGGYELAGRKLGLALGRGAALEPTDFRLEWQPAAGKKPERGSLSAKLLELEPLARLADALPLPAQARQRLAEIAPRGRLADARLEWTGKPSAPEKLALRTRFADLAANASGGVPGFAGLSGTIDASESKGSLHVASRHAWIDLPRLFSDSRLRFDSLEGQLGWQRQGERAFSLTLASLAFANEDLEGKASGSYSNAGAGPGTIDLSASLSRASAAHFARYLPLPEIMGKPVHDYLAAAILGGTSSDARLRLRGDLRDFPFLDPAKGLFQVSARVEKGVLEYVPGWPQIHDIDAELLFEADRMEIVGRRGSILGAQIANAQVTIPSMLSPPVRLLVNGQADGPTGEFLRYVESSPVQRMVGGFTEGMLAEGRGRLRLKLELPLADLKASKVAGEYEFTGNNVIVHANLPPIERAAGRLSFTESSFAVHEVKGRLFDGALTINGATRRDGGVEIVAKGDATVPALRAVFDHPLARYLSGSTAYTATVNVSEGRTRLRFESSLRGVASALPAPLTKNAADALPLRVEVLPSESGARDRVSLTFGHLASAEFLRRRQGRQMAVQRAGVWLSPEGEQPLRLPERPGTLIYGSLAAFDFDRWLPFLGEGEGGVEALAFDLRIGTLDAYGKRVHDIALRAGVETAGWSASVDAKELAGEVSYRNEAGGQLIARLTHLSVPDDYPGAKPADATRNRELPALDLIAERFVFRDRQIGRVELKAQRSGPDWRVDHLALVTPEATLNGRGLWRTAPAGSWFSFELSVSAADKFLARLGYAKVLLGGAADMQGTLYWQGDPAAIDYSTLSGEVQLQARKGQFVKIDPGIGKLISLMSLQELPRRLSLDFRDVFAEGFQFDTIFTAAGIEKGTMKLKDFRMNGSSAEVTMAGEVDLAKETQNLRVRVVPSVDNIAATWICIVNPILCFPALIAPKILKNPFGHIFAFDYAVTGNWADPEVAKVRVEAQPVEQPQGIN